MTKILMFCLTLTLLVTSFASKGPMTVVKMLLPETGFSSATDTQAKTDENLFASRTYDDLEKLPSGPSLDYSFLPASSAWLEFVGAGVLLGAGVNVESDGTVLDIELYASIDVYIALMDKRFNLVCARPTIYNKQQADMHGYKVSFLETYVNPGRVGGLIEEEPPEEGGDYIPSTGLQYKIWIVPKNAIGSFDESKREAILSADRADVQKPLKAKVRTYPENTYAKTNNEGEFFQEDNNICYGGDQVYLEFKAIINGAEKTLFAGPSTPILPFTDVTITYADCFNDYITGKVEPKKLINWASNRFNPDEEQHVLTYYEGPIYIQPFNDYGFEPGSYGPHAKHLPYAVSGKAHTDTNEKGEFDTRNPYRDGNAYYPSGTIDVLEQESQQYYYYDSDGNKQYFPNYPPDKIGVIASLDINEEVNNITVYGIKAAVPEFQITRTIDLVENSYKKISEGGKIVNQMMYDEYLWISNPTGTRTVTADMVTYIVEGFSTQDYKGYYENPVKETMDGPLTLMPVLDDDGNPTGTALFAQRVTVQWVWQEHPNPIKITSSDNAQAVSGEEATFQVKSEGFLPRFSLEGEPQRVWIDEITGLLYIPKTLEPGKYTFTIHAQEGIAITSVYAPDPKKGNDASPPDKQLFTLTITENPAGPSLPQTSTGPGATPGSTPDPDNAQTAPVIYVDEYNTYFNMDGSSDLTVSFKASGSPPIKWELTAVSGKSIPAEATIDAETGVLTIQKTIAAGTYSFAVKASNEAGSDTHECTVAVTESIAPVLENRRDGYIFKITSLDKEFSVQIKATGSAPITYSLEPVNERLPVPEELIIDPVTGVLSLKGGLTAGIRPGVYDFIIKARNSAGYDTRECKLEVTTPVLQFKNIIDSIMDNLLKAAKLLLVSAKPGTGTGINQNLPPAVLKPDLFAKDTPPNKLTLLCDDPKDVYTHDRDIYNGAYFIRWDSHVIIKIMDVVESVSYALGSNGNPYVKLVTLGDEVIISDNSPVCDRYHYYDPDNPMPSLPLSEEELEKMKANMLKDIKAKIAEYENGYKNINLDLSADGMRDRYFGFKSNPFDRTISSLEYGSLINEISSKKGGAFNVELNAETGTVITGKYFVSLKSNPEASITFRQDGADITFAGKDVKNAGALDMFNIGLTFAPHETDMLEAVGAGSESFAYGFQHHGQLPGMATFDVSTTLAEGTKANVYKYDAADGKFTLIAKGVIAGAKGVVNYKNNSMSEYIITTKEISNAAVSDINSLLNPTGRISLWIICICIAVLITGGTAGWLILRKRKQTQSY